MADDVVLIGGQALNFWADRFEQRSVELAQGAPYTSKDIDFCGGAEHVERCAKLLGARHKLYGPDDLSVCTGIVTTNEGIDLDFVHSPRGVPPSEVKRRAIAFISLRVMHPIHVLISRAANVVHIPRSDDHALGQLRAAVFVVREFIREVLTQVGGRAAHDLNEEAFRVAKNGDALAVWRTYEIDLFAAVLQHPALGTKFADIRYPQMRKQLEALRR